MNKYSEFTDNELIVALELLVTRDDLKIRGAAEALLDAFGYSSKEIREQIASGKYLSEGQPLGIVTLA